MVFAYQGFDQCVGSFNRRDLGDSQRRLVGQAVIQLDGYRKQFSPMA
ncbi:hypothetical protein Pan97_45800 [Bremerella volcania]|uniref:Uncharacterized protein n=1 Tax=Bremerella volcania TaxID=2527984 RepID=A0A518CE57_9BACT|nr:hypothetical protein Pan97_45800 [Bremerella volcania]